LLVVWNILYVSIQLGRIIQTDEVILFQRVGIPPTRLRFSKPRKDAEKWFQDGSSIDWGSNYLGAVEATCMDITSEINPRKVGYNPYNYGYNWLHSIHTYNPYMVIHILYIHILWI
jgi:hypothetical protein